MGFGDRLPRRQGGEWLQSVGPCTGCYTCMSVWHGRHEPRNGASSSSLWSTPAASCVWLLTWRPPTAATKCSSESGCFCIIVYHGRQLPQVSLLLQQNTSFVMTKVCLLQQSLSQQNYVCCYTIILSQQTSACCNKSFVATSILLLRKWCLSQQIFVVRKVMTKIFCCDKHTFVVTKIVFCRNKPVFVVLTCVCGDKTFVVTKIVFCGNKPVFVVLTCVCGDKTFVATKMILGAAPASDSFGPLLFWFVPASDSFGPLLFWFVPASDSFGPLLFLVCSCQW